MKWSLLMVALFCILENNLCAQQDNTVSDVAFVLRGYEGSCYFCDSIDFDIQARVIIEKLSDLSFGKINSYTIMDAGIDMRSPVNLQSVRDIHTLQSSLNGWPGPEWDWLRNRTDFWLVVPEEYIPIIESAIAWMDSTGRDFASWGDETELGTDHYWVIQSNVQRMGPSAASDFLQGMKMPAAYRPEDYGTTLVILHSASENQIAGGGAASSLSFFGVLDADGNAYPPKFDGNFNAVAYIGATPLNFSFYSTAVHEAIHALGMGTHDQDPQGIVNNYSIMYRANLNTINTFPAWDRYFWTNWLPYETITNDSTEISDLAHRYDAMDASLKFIYVVNKGDERGAGGSYKELYQGKWYSYTVDGGGTLSFTDTIDNEHFFPTNYILTIPEIIYEGRTITFGAYSDGAPQIYEWFKDGISLQMSPSNEFRIDSITENDSGLYYVQIRNNLGELTTDSVLVQVQCERPAIPEVSDYQYCQGDPTNALMAELKEGSNLKWYGMSSSGGEWTLDAPIPSTEEAGTFSYYVSTVNENGCESERALIEVFITPTPPTPTISLDSGIYLISNAEGNKWYKDGVETGDTAQRIIPDGSGIYTVTSTIDGCESEHSEPFDFISSIYHLQPNEFISVFPNPTLNDITVRFDLNKVRLIQLHLYNIAGQKVKVTEFLSNDARISLEALDPGYYIIEFKSPDLIIDWKEHVIKI